MGESGTFRFKAADSNRFLKEIKHFSSNYMKAKEDIPSAPSDLKLKAIKATEIILTWKSNSNNKKGGFFIMRSKELLWVGPYTSLLMASADSYKSLEAPN